MFWAEFSLLLSQQTILTTFYSMCLMTFYTAVIKPKSTSCKFSAKKVKTSKLSDSASVMANVTLFVYWYVTMVNIKQWHWTASIKRAASPLPGITWWIKKELECGPMPNVMTAQPNIGGALCKSSIIPFLVPCHKVWLTPAAGVLCSNTANIRERKTLT